MKWNKVKKAVADGLYTRVLTGGDSAAMALDLVVSDFAAKRGRTNEEMCEAYAQEARQVVMGWDIRCAGKLRELFPHFFPPSLKGRLVADIGDGGEWEIFSQL